jgi:hypothetical protein
MEVIQFLIQLPQQVAAAAALVNKAEERKRQD